MLRGVILGGLLLGAAGCGPRFAGGVFTREGLSYRVTQPSGPGWRPVNLSDNDLAWVSPDGHLISINALCEGHEDPPLEVLTNHLLIGFTDRELVERKRFTLDGREALRTFMKARLDGVKTSLELVVLKKNGCVHDFTYVSPVGQEATHQAAFDALVAGFRQERTP